MFMLKQKKSYWENINLANFIMKILVIITIESNWYTITKTFKIITFIVNVGNCYFWIN